MFQKTLAFFPSIIFFIIDMIRNNACYTRRLCHQLTFEILEQFGTIMQFDIKSAQVLLFKYYISKAFMCCVQ
jgi:hypothetical protein